MIRRTWPVFAALLACADAPPPPIAFESVQVDLFGVSGGQPNAWADFDNDGDLDLFVGMRGHPNRLYRNDGGAFIDVAADVGLADTADTRAAAWGDYDGDGHLDLYVGYGNVPGLANRVYRNLGDGSSFRDMAPDLGIVILGNSRQPTWVDYDQDGDLDLFAALRDFPNRLFRNDGARFADVTEASGIGDPRRTVGVVWFDLDEDGDLDLHVSNQNGDEDGVFRNNGDGTFTDVAAELGMHFPGRGNEYGSVGPAVTDYDNDGDLDLFIASYGPDILWENQGSARFVEVANGTPLGVDRHSTTAAWGDVNHDGRPDLFVAAYLNSVPEDPDHLFVNTEAGFVDSIPPSMLERGASHGVSFADFDGDGDLDLALANNNAVGTHPLYRNLLPVGDARRSIQVSVTDAAGRHTMAGAEVRVFHASSGELLGTRLVDTGGGYCSQSVKPVHVGIDPGVEVVRVEVTSFRGGERVVTAVEDLVIAELGTRPLVVRVGETS